MISGLELRRLLQQPYCFNQFRFKCAVYRKKIKGGLKGGLKGGVNLNAIFPPLDMALMEISRSRFKQSKNSMLIP